jgi:hypothetical protein
MIEEMGTSLSRFSIAVVAFFSLLSFGQSGGDFTYEDLVRLIQQSTPPIHSIDELISHLPKEMRSNFVLMHDSKSIQPGDLKHPRVIMSSFSGKLACAFSTGEMLECYQFRDQGSRFDFRAIDFSQAASTSSGGGVLFSESNQSPDGKIQCTSCHGKDPRPNWEAYKVWPGAYGSHDDSMFKGEDDAERNKFLEFKADSLNSPRYRDLIFDPTNPVSPYMDNAYTGRGTKYSPNLRLGEEISRLTALRDTRLLKELPRYRSYLFLMAEAGCPVKPEEKKNYSQFLELDPKTKQLLRSFRASLVNQITEATWTPFFRNFDPTCSPCNYLGTAGNDQNPATDPSVSDPGLLGVGFTPYSYNYRDGVTSMNDFIAAETMKYLISTGDNDLSPFYSSTKGFAQSSEAAYPDSDDDFVKQFNQTLDSTLLPIDFDKLQKSCDLLYRKFKVSFKSTGMNQSVRTSSTNNPAQTAADPNCLVKTPDQAFAQVTALVNSSAPALQSNSKDLISSCLKCHSDPKKYYFIPFNEPTKLTDQQLSEIKFKISDKADQAGEERMPKGGPTLTPDQQNKLVNYLLEQRGEAASK